MNLAHRTGAILGSTLAMTALGGIGGDGTPPTFFVTNGSTLYRYTDGFLESFELEVELSGLTFDDSGRLWGTQVGDTDQDGKYCLHEIINPFGALSAVDRGDFLPGKTSALNFIDGSLVGFEETVGTVMTIDHAAQSTGIAALLGEASTRPTSTAYDPDTGNLYGIRDFILYSFDVEGGFAQSTIGPVDPGVQGPKGGDWFDGEYYHVINDGAFANMFTVNVLTGDVEFLFAFESEGRGATGLAIGVVPTPGSAMLLTFAALTATRRRR